MISFPENYNMSAQKMRVAVLMATYNGSDWVVEQIQSILRCSSNSIDIIISDDGSTDDTIEKIKSLSLENVFILPSKKSGSSAKNFFNLIFSTALLEYDFFAFSDQDDIWIEGKIDRAISQLIEKKADGYSSNVIAFFDKKKAKVIKKSQPQKRLDFLFESPGPGNTFVIPKVGMMFLYESLRDISKSDLDQISFHDWFIYAVFRGHQKEWIIDDFVSVQYRQHSSNVIGAPSGLRAVSLRLSKILSGWYLDQVRKTYELTCVDNKIREVIYLERNAFFKIPSISYAGRRKFGDVITLLVILYYSWFKENFVTLR